LPGASTNKVKVFWFFFKKELFASRLLSLKAQHSLRFDESDCMGTKRRILSTRWPAVALREVSCPLFAAIVHFLIQVKPPTAAQSNDAVSSFSRGKRMSRLRSDASLNKPDPAAFCGIGPKGYTGYSMLADGVAA
jgi:hypothetical protein